MPVTKPFGQISIGGTGVNNPPDYSWTTYDNYPGLDLGRTYQRVNVIAFHDTLKVYLQVTGLAVVASGQPLIGPTDSCFMPCPPYCE